MRRALPGWNRPGGPGGRRSAAVVLTTVGYARSPPADESTRLLAARCRHPHPVLRTERDLRIQPHRVAGLQAEPPLLRHGGEQQDALHPRERLTDAQPRPSAEREVGVPGPFRFLLRLPTLPIEPPRLREPPGVALRRVLAE